MNAFTLKVLALTCMLVDHIGLFFFPDNVLLRAIGRLSFPLFAFLLANGMHYSHNRINYFLRLLLFTAISQIPFSLAFNLIPVSGSSFNIFFTLTLGFLGIVILRTTQNTVTRAILLTLLLVVSSFLQISYGIGGILSIVFFYYYFKSPRKLVLSQIVIGFSCYFIPELLNIYLHAPINVINLIQPIGLGSLFFILTYNKHNGPKFTYFFYLFYPLHLLFIYFFILFTK